MSFPLKALGFRINVINFSAHDWYSYRFEQLSPLNISTFKFILGEIEALHTYLVEEVAAGMRCKRSSVIRTRITNAKKILVGNRKRLANYNRFL